MNEPIVDPIRLELGFDLVPLAKQELGGTLVDRIARLRQEILLRVGILLPPVRLRDNFEIKSKELIVFLKGISIRKFEVNFGADSSIPAELPDATKSIIRHLSNVFLERAPELIDFDQIDYLLEQHARSYPALIREFNRTFPHKLTLLKILRRLLYERQGICNLPIILETFLEFGNELSPGRITNLIRDRLRNSSEDFP